MRSNRNRTLLTLVGLITTTLGVTAATSTSAEAAFACSMPSTDYTYTWTGNGPNDNWTTDANWSSVAGGHPNDNIGGDVSFHDGNETARAYVCIPDGFNVDVIGTSVKLESVDLGDSTLNVTGNSAFFVMGTTPAVTRDLSTVVVTSSEIGGSNELRISGELLLNSTGGGASSIEPTKIINHSSPGAPSTGTMTVEDSGLVTVTGPTNVLRQYRLVVRGKVVLTVGGYLSADHGSSFELRPKSGSAGVGALEITNDGHYYEGNPGTANLSTFVNQGRIVKSGGTFSGIYADYTLVAPGSVEVTSGTLLIPDSDDPVNVSTGASFGSGTCAVWSVPCIPTVRSNDPQSATFTPATTNPGGAAVEIVEASAAPRGSRRDLPPGTLGSEIEVSASNLVMNRSNPHTIVMSFDTSLVGALGPAELMIEREPVGDQFRPLPNCGTGGVVPSTATACVDRAASRKITTGAADAVGDIEMVVKTVGTSRWIGRRDGPVEQAAHQVSTLTQSLDPTTGNRIVAWEAPTTSTGLSQYVVDVDGVIRTVPASSTEVVLSGLAPGPHTVSITADYSGYSRPAVSMTVFVPEGPRNLRATWTPKTLRADVSWTPPDDLAGIQGYVVSVDGAARPLVSTTADSVAGLSPGSHTIAVAAQLESGTMGPTTVTSVVVPSEVRPGRVVGVRTLPTTTQPGPGLTVNWQAPQIRREYVVDYIVEVIRPRSKAYRAIVTRPAPVQVYVANRGKCTVRIYARNRAGQHLGAVAYTVSPR